MAEVPKIDTVSDPSIQPAGAAVGRGRICILYNPGAGKKLGDQAEQAIRAACKSLPHSVAIRKLDRKRSPSEHAQAALQDGFDIIVAAGGDGTVSGVAATLAGSGCVLGVLPLGTFNYLARSLGIPETIEDAVAVLGSGQVRALGLGRVNGQPFINNASLGAYPAILEERERSYARWGRSRIVAYWSVLKALVRRTHRMKLTMTVDGEERSFRTPLVFVVKNAFQLEQLELDGAEIVRSGRFAVFVAPDRGWSGLLLEALALAAGRLQRSRDFELLAGREVKIRTGRSRNKIARDGERDLVGGSLRLELEPDALRVVVPASTMEDSTRALP